MTSTVKVSAHCASTKQVYVVLYDYNTGATVEEFILQDGESADRVVFDTRGIAIREVDKQAQVEE